MGEVDPIGLCNQPKELAVTIEAPGAAGLDDFQGRFAITIEQLRVGVSGRVFIRKFNRYGAEPTCVDYGYDILTGDPADRCSVCKVLELCHIRTSTFRTTFARHGS